tara:strand:- start:27108 stop:27824 length:717 start_codon:yes stop_codon:yes gene_type:complete
MNKNSVIAMIPARIGSQRLKYKNLALINDKPLIYYSINAAKKSGIFDKIVLNSDSSIFQFVAKKYKIDFYQRPNKLGKSNVLSDDVVLDFINKYEYSTIVWVNPIAPLQTGNQIRKTVKYFLKNKYNSLITVNKKHTHFIYNKKPINFKLNKKFNKTQDLKPLYEMNYSLMMWNTKSFKQSMKRNNFAITHGKFSFYPSDKLSSFIIKDEKDLFIVEKIISSFNKSNIVKYDKILESK